MLERDSNLCVLEAPFGRDDVGSWLALPRLLGTNTEGNTVDGPHVGLQTQDCLVRTTPDHLVATIGVEGLVIVHTEDATLLARKGDEEAIKKLVERLAAEGYVRFQ